VGCEGIEPLVIHLTFFSDNGFTGRREEHNPSGAGGSRTRMHEGLSFAALPFCVPRRRILLLEAIQKGQSHFRLDEN
jgi:hypothetical protein